MHTTKRAVLLSCSDHYNHRLYVIDGYLRSLGYETVYYTSDFDHTSKKVFRCTVPGCRQIHVRPYQKNLSLSRILSHRDFAHLVFQELEQDPPDVVVAQLPPNYLAHYAARFKARYPETRLIFEIFDMWPETFPTSSPSSPCPAARATSRCLGWTASPPPVRAAAPSTRISPSIWSCAARACMPRP